MTTRWRTSRIRSTCGASVSSWSRNCYLPHEEGEAGRSVPTADRSALGPGNEPKARKAEGRLGVEVGAVPSHDRKMSIEEQGPDDELRGLVGALREHLRWQDACGAHGLPRAPEPRAEALQEAERGVEALPAPEPTVVRAKMVAQDEGPRAPEAGAASSPRRVVWSTPEPAEERSARLADLQAQVEACTGCPLHQSRRNVVYGAGPVDAEIMIVGEGPGAEEDRQGVPFVGKAGKLLDKMLAAMGFDRSQVYIGNIVKCRPPDNRNPEREEMVACFPYLQQQIALVRPQVIIAMGGTAVRGLLGIGGVTRVRGKWKLYRAEIPVMPTFHPAYLLRQEEAKRDAWNDLKEVLRHLKREVPPRGR